MTTITVSPDTAKIILDLQEQATEKGILLEELLRSVSERFARSPETFLSPQRKAEAWENWANSHSFNQTVINDDSRESLYSNENEF
jgi:uncharacterized protein YcaQ